MNSRLPKVFVSPITTKLNNNQEISDIREDKKESNINLDDIFDDSKFLFKHRYYITLKNNKVLESSIISRFNKKILTIDNDIVDEDDIKSIVEIKK